MVTTQIRLDGGPDFTSPANECATRSYLLERQRFPLKNRVSDWAGTRRRAWHP
jgi:hypothetical protein